jgi:uncharacterized protein
MPTITRENRAFWTGGANGQLLIQRCDSCGRWVHPPSKACAFCGGGTLTPQPTSGKGTVFSFTINRHPYNPAVPLPYVIAIVELAEQDDLRLITNMVNVDPEKVTVGMPVRVLFEQHGEVFVPIFEPDSEAS